MLSNSNVILCVVRPGYDCNTGVVKVPCFLAESKALPGNKPRWITLSQETLSTRSLVITVTALLANHLDHFQNRSKHCTNSHHMILCKSHMTINVHIT